MIGPREPVVHYSPEARRALESAVEIEPIKRRIVFTSDECPNCESMRGQAKDLAEMVRTTREELARVRRTRTTEQMIEWLDAATGESHADLVGRAGWILLEGGEADLAALRAMQPQHVIEIMRRFGEWRGDTATAAARANDLPPGEARDAARAKARAEADARRQELALEFTRYGLPQPILERFLKLQ